MKLQRGAAMKREQGFTIIEVIIAIIVLTVGILGLMSSAALVTRMIARGQRSAVQASFAARRLEILRYSGCGSQAAGTEVLMRGGVPVDSLTWRFVALADPNQANTWQVIIRSKYQTALGKWRTDSTENEVPCTP